MSDSLGGDPDQPNRGYPYTFTTDEHDFGEAKGVRDGIRLSRWHRRRKTPFGDEFDYTEDLTGRSSGESFTWAGRMKARWRVFMGRFRKQPVAWVTIDYDEAPIYTKNPSAYLLHGQSEIRIIPIEQRILMPIHENYINKAMFTMDGYEQAQENPKLRVVGEDE